MLWQLRVIGNGLSHLSESKNMKKKTITDRIIDAVFYPSFRQPHPLTKVRCENCGKGWTFVNEKFCGDCLEREAIKLSMEEDAASAHKNYELAN